MGPITNTNQFAFSTGESNVQAWIYIFGLMLEWFGYWIYIPIVNASQESSAHTKIYTVRQVNNFKSPSIIFLHISKSPAQTETFNTHTSTQRQYINFLITAANTCFCAWQSCGDFGRQRGHRNRVPAALCVRTHVTASIIPISVALARRCLCPRNCPCFLLWVCIKMAYSVLLCDCTMRGCVS